MSAQGTKKPKNKKISKISTEELRQKLKLKHLEAQKKFKEKFPDIYNRLIEKGIDPGKIRLHSAKLLGTGILTGSLLLSPARGLEIPAQAYEIVEKFKFKEGEKNKNRTKNLREVLLNTLR